MDNRYEPGAAGTEKGGLVWADRGDLGAIAGGQEPSYTLSLTVGPGWTPPAVGRGWRIRTAAEIGARYGSTNELAESAFRIGGLAARRARCRRGGRDRRRPDHRAAPPGRAAHRGRCRA
ncbi:hypothetical protein ACIA8K_35350 [Catenuloplanes sp. NPDC051500]|uniref:hypothetical protein n=1 Tax=Catenuloplanes sp. NPDC051500 TaxID=3363959 RepID=UPI003794D915